MRLSTLVPTCLLLSCFGLGCADDGEEGRVIVRDIDARAPDVASDAAAPDASTCSDSIGGQDFDRDGYSREDGDCDDCDRARGPGSLDVPNNGIDEDCSGSDATSEPLHGCDDGLEEEGGKVEAVVKALGLCAPRVLRTSSRPGLIDARWLNLADEEQLRDARQVWLPERFGTITPHEGARMLVLSTGVARDARAKGYTEACDVFGSSWSANDRTWSNGQPPPKGYPRDASQCKDQGVSEGALAYDDVGLELTLRAPGNATALVFDSMFFTYEYPDYVCSRFNDFFVALLDGADRRFADGNVLVDGEGDPIGVNSGLLSVCSQTTRAARPIACTLGPSLLQGTGYGAKEATCAPLAGNHESLGGASTGWLHTEVPVQPGAVFKLRFALWDSGDPLLDSTVVLDDMHFIATPPVVGTTSFTAP